MYVQVTQLLHGASEEIKAHLVTTACDTSKWEAEVEEKNQRQELPAEIVAEGVDDLLGIQSFSQAPPGPLRPICSHLELLPLCPMCMKIIRAGNSTDCQLHRSFY